MPSHQELVEEVAQKINNKRSMYGSVLITSAIRKQGDVWKNIVTKILPLHVSDTCTPKEKMDYGEFAIIEDLVTLDYLIETLRKLPEKGMTTINVGGYELQVDGTSLTNGYYKYDSGSEHLGIEWFFEKYQYVGQQQSYQSQPLTSPRLPLFPDTRSAIEAFLGIDLSRDSGSFGIIICLPNYGARIEEVNIGSNEIRVKIQVKTEDVKNIIGKLYCQKGRNIKQEDIEFASETGTIAIGFKPDSLYFVLLSKVTSEILDSRRLYPGWELPKGVVIAIPEYEIIELIRNGETDTVEFKEDIGKPEELAETVVSFANGKGGVILLGVNNNANVVGLGQKDYESTMTNILRSHCEPQKIKYEINKRQLDEKNIMLLRVEEGKDKPYTVREKGVYVRANATDRVATRYELDEFYKEKHSGFHYWP
jgi:hypothetical protein